MPQPEPTAAAPQQEQRGTLSRSGDRLAGNSWLLALVLVVVTFLAYLPALSGKFVWDDDFWTTRIPQLLRDVSGLLSMWWHATALQQYYPLTGTTFWLDYHLWGFSTLPYHVENVLLHALAALLFWRLLSRLEVPGAWLAAAIFALHPVMVESAAWITERKNVLSLVLYLSALLVYARRISFWKGYGDSALHADNSPTYDASYLAAWLLFLGALLAKTTALSLPAVVLLICWWKRGRIRWRQDVVPTLPFFAPAIALGAVTAWLERTHVGAVGPEWAISFPQRCLIAGRALAFYTGKLLWPANLCFVYPRWHLDVHSLRQWLYPTLAVATLLALWSARKRIGRGPVAAAFFFIGTLFPVLGFTNVFFMRYSLVCDHWAYLPSLGPIALAAAGIATVFKWSRRRPAPLESALCATLLLLLAAGTWRQAHIYQNQETLWRDTLTKNPRCRMVHNNLGNASLQAGNLADALRHYELALQDNLDLADVHNNLGTALVQSGKLQAAIEQFRLAVRLDPDLATARYNLGLALAKQGHQPEAIQQWEQAVRLQPNKTEAQIDLADAFLQTGRIPDAITHYQQVLRFRPDDAEAHRKLAVALIAAGNLREAITHLEHALRVNPDSAEAQNNLAWLLATLPQTDGGDPTRALSLAQWACERTSNRVAAYLDTLAVAYAAAGRFGEAIATAQKAIELARSTRQPKLADEIESRLQLYRSGHPYRAPAPPL
jgi:tetratricopeptide (TPR) repeat protein